MNVQITRRWAMGACAAAFIAMAIVAPTVFASKSAVKMKHWIGTIDYVPDGPSPFMMQGTGSHLGDFTAVGEVTLVPVDESGLMLGAGVVVFTSANGDQLVGETEWVVNGEEISEIRFRWRESVEFSNTMIATNTGRFVTDRPPGLVVIMVIRILVGYFVPVDYPNYK